MAGIIIYSIPQVIQVVEPSNPAGGVMTTSFHHTRSDFKVFWNVDNDIDFFVRDYDRKIKALGTDSYAIIVTNPRSGKIIMQSPLTVMDAAKGHLRLTISAVDATQLPIGTLRYSITKTAASKTTLLYSDIDYGAQSTLEVKYGPIPAEVEPTVISRASFATIDGALRAGSFEGPASLVDASGLRTFIITGDNFSGSLTFEASLTDTPPSSAQDWFTATYVNFSALAGSQVVNLEGNYAWVRIKLIETTGSLVEIIMK